MKNIVVTYFEPFGNRTTNASKEVVSLLNGFEIQELPVSWDNVIPLIDEILSDEPDYLFLVGEAGSYKEITMEKTAHNIALGIDNCGKNMEDVPIINGGYDVLNTKFDLSSLSYLASENAGRYLCNYTYYLALSKSKNTKVLFVHLPYVNGNLDNLKDALLDIINTLTK